MRRIALLLAAAPGLFFVACETQGDAAGLQAPCERNTDCVAGLYCSAGVCTAADAVAPDGGEKADSDVGDAAAEHQ